jgi:epsilon-lactone hydrolase
MTVSPELHQFAQFLESVGAGRVPEVDQAIDQMGRWLRRHLGA